MFVEIVNRNLNISSFPGISLLIASGLHIGWGIWRAVVFFEPWSLYLSLGMSQFVLMSWYVFAVVGSVVGAILVTKMRKKLIYVSDFSLT